MSDPTFHIVAEKSLAGEIPLNTGACALAVDQDREMVYIYGGFQLPAMEVPLGDLWELDVKKGLWTKLTVCVS